MKIKVTARFIWLLAMLALISVVPRSRSAEVADTNIYSIYAWGGDDDYHYTDHSSTMKLYSDYCESQRILLEAGLVGPLPEQLPVLQDTNGHWGPITDDLQLSVRF